MSDRTIVTLVIEFEVDTATIDNLPSFENGPTEPPTSGIEHECLMKLSEYSHDLWKDWQPRFAGKIANLWWSTVPVDDITDTF